MNDYNNKNYNPSATKIYILFFYIFSYIYIYVNKIKDVWPANSPSVTAESKAKKSPRIEWFLSLWTQTQREENLITSCSINKTSYKTTKKYSSQCKIRAILKEKKIVSLLFYFYNFWFVLWIIQNKSSVFFLKFFYGKIKVVLIINFDENDITLIKTNHMNSCKNYCVHNS